MTKRIIYRGCHIWHNGYCWSWTHPDYDGAPDSHQMWGGGGTSERNCRVEIDEFFEENDEAVEYADDQRTPEFTERNKRIMGDAITLPVYGQDPNSWASRAGMGGEELRRRVDRLRARVRGKEAWGAR